MGKPVHVSVTPRISKATGTVRVQTTIRNGSTTKVSTLSVKGK